MIGEKIIVLTFDTDWAPPFVIQRVLDLLGDTPATFNITDKSARDLLVQHPQVELGIHPNFMPGSTHGRTRQEVMETVMKMVPDAKTVRGHNLFQDTTVLDLYVEFGIRQDATNCEYLNPNPILYRYWNGLIRVPNNVDDSVALIRADNFKIQDWMLKSNLLVCTFHPIHIYLNTDCLERYTNLKNKGSLANMKPKDIQPFVNRNKLGVRDCFIALLRHVSQGLRTPLTVTQLVSTCPVVEYCEVNGSRQLSTRQSTFSSRS